MNDRAKPHIPLIDRLEFELACVREFSHSGAQLGPSVSRAERRERIRLAILREEKANLCWRDTVHSYADVYQYVYGKSLGRLSIEEGRELSHATHPRFLLSEAYVTAHEPEADEDEADEEIDEEEDNEALP